MESPRDGKEEDLTDRVSGAPDETPFFFCLRSEVKGLLVQAIGELAEKEQRVLSLYYYEELTMREVGAKCSGSGNREFRRFIRWRWSGCGRG